jgi:acyl carrier protein
MTVDDSLDRRVMEAVARVFHKEVTEITRDTHFVADLFAKSINIVELIAILEYEFSVDIPGAEARRNKTVGEAIDFLAELIKK